MTRPIPITLFALLFLFTAAPALAGDVGKLRVAVDQPGAYIYVDGQKKAMAADEGYTDILLPGGEYEIKAEKEIPGRSGVVMQATRKVFVGADTSTKINLELSEVDLKARKAFEGDPKGFILSRLKMQPIPEGCFRMGDLNGEGQDREKPVHKVCVDAFEMSAYEVTFALWDACRADGGCTHNPDDEGWGRGERPVVNVSWEDAQEFIGWLNRRAGGGWDLPTEAQWEYAARAGTTSVYHWGNSIGRNNANCDGCGSRWDDKQTAPVGSFKANAWGLHDMHGNVWEWCKDWYESNYYANSPRSNPKGPSSGKYRVLRGGSWPNFPSWARSANRGHGTPSSRDTGHGFRVVRRAR